MPNFDSIQNDIDWAKSRLQQAGELFIAYVDDQPFALVEEANPNTGGKVQKIRQVKAPPVDFAHLIRNAVLDLKHSFDRSLFTAAYLEGQVRFKKNYPWAQSVKGVGDKLKAWEREKRFTLPDKIITEIYRQKPYSGSPEPPDRLYLVREVAKIANGKHSIGFVFTAQPNLTMINGGYFKNASLVLDSPWDAVSNEMVLAEIAPGGAAVYGKTAFSVDVFFESAGPIGRVSVSVAVREFLKAAQACLDGFKAVCGH